MTKTLIFDFDGTIADTFSTTFDILRSLAKKYQYTAPSIEDISTIRNHSIQQIAKELHVPLYKLPFIVHDAKKELNKHIAALKPISGMDDVLRSLKKKGYNLVIITSNNMDNVTLFLEKNKLNFFESIHSGTNIFGKSSAIKGFLKKNKISTNDTVYIGDEIRDIESTKKIHIPIIAVSWGYNSRKGLERLHPEYLIDHPKELLTILDTNFSIK